MNTRKKKTTEEFKKEIYDLVKNEYTVLDNYQNNKTKIRFKHSKCNNIFSMRPNNFLNGQRCPYCNEYRNIKKTTEEFRKEIYNLAKDEYSLLSDYQGVNKLITLRHNKCNNIYKTRPHNFLQGNRCPKCSIKKVIIKNTKTTKEFKKEIYNITNDEYSLLNKYVNNSTPILLYHKKCNKKFYTRPNNFLQGHRCPYCNESKGEEKISKWLDENNIIYERQFTFSDCKYKKPLKFDFKLQDDSGRIILIEYDGIQHYEKKYYSNQFNEQQKRDNIKNEYCKNHKDIDLYHISYKDYNNIEIILENIIKKYE